jgi:hypothetical protein
MMARARPASCVAALQRPQEEEKAPEEEACTREGSRSLGAGSSTADQEEEARSMEGTSTPPEAGGGGAGGARSSHERRGMPPLFARDRPELSSTSELFPITARKAQPQRTQTETHARHTPLTALVTAIHALVALLPSPAPLRLRHAPPPTGACLSTRPRPPPPGAVGTRRSPARRPPRRGPHGLLRSLRACGG